MCKYVTLPNCVGFFKEPSRLSKQQLDLQMRKYLTLLNLTGFSKNPVIYQSKSLTHKCLGYLRELGSNPSLIKCLRIRLLKN